MIIAGEDSWAANRDRSLWSYTVGCRLLKFNKLGHEVITEKNNQYISVSVILPDNCNTVAFPAQAIYNYLTNL